MSASTGQRTRSAAIRRQIRDLEGTGMRTFAEPEPLVWDRTDATTIWDADGHAYLDLYAGFAAASVGYCHPRVTAAITRQAALMTHCPSAAPSGVRAELYQRLIGIAPSGLDRVLPAVTGAAANETAIQIARAATGRSAVISFAGTYLGRTVGAVRYAGKRAYRERLGIASDAQFLPYPNPYRSAWTRGADTGELVLALLEQLIDDPASGMDAAACIVVEPIQGNGGVVIPPDGFLAGLRRLATKAGAVLIFDEIQCGFGRSGRMWACDHEAVVPDLMTIGKGIGGGLPLAAVLGREGLMTSLPADAITSTFVTNALTAAAGVAAVDVLTDEGLVERSARLGADALTQLRAGLRDNDRVGDVRGRGLFIGIELVKDTGASEPDPERTLAAIEALRERGVIVGRGGSYGNVVKVSPALIIDPADLDAGIAKIVEVLA